MKKSTLSFAVMAFFAAILFSATTANGQTLPPAWTGWYEGSNEWTDEEMTNVEPVIVAAPNPATTQEIKVYYKQIQGQAQISLFDISGRLEDQVTVGADHENAGAYSFSLASLSPGIYFVKLTNGLYESVQKVIVR